MAKRSNKAAKADAHERPGVGDNRNRRRGGGGGSGSSVVGLGNFHKTLPHNPQGEVDANAFAALQAEAAKRRNVPPQSGDADVNTFSTLPDGDPVLLPVAAGFKVAQLTNPLAGLAIDPLVPRPETFTMPAPPDVQSKGTAAEMTELYWMALLRDVPFDQAGIGNVSFVEAAEELQGVFEQAKSEGTLVAGIDLPCGPITGANVFRIGLPGEEAGPMLSQFWLRDIQYGTQRIDQMQDPYRRGLNFLTRFDEWLHAQNTGRGRDGSDYPQSNELAPSLYLEGPRRYISCMRDLARFVNKDALHQAYFNAALSLLNGGARWTPGNPYADVDLMGMPVRRDAGFGTLGGPHILALVSEVATRALETVWFQKWQTWLRLRPEAYAGHLHVQVIGANGPKRPYGLQATSAFAPEAHERVRELNRVTNGGDEDDETLLLPMAFTAGSPKHPAYGAGHATVAGACVTILKAYFKLLEDDSAPTTGAGATPLPLSRLSNFPTFISGIDQGSGAGTLSNIPDSGLTIEGELNKLASNVAMGRSMGGVHWRTDNTRSLILGEAMAAHVLAGLSTGLIEKPTFVFRTFGQVKDAGGNWAPKLVTIGPDLGDITKPKITIDGEAYKLTNGTGPGSSLSNLLNPPAEFQVP